MVTPVPLAARVNGQPILLANFERELARAGTTIAPRQVLDGMIEMLLLEQAAIAAGITVSGQAREPTPARAGEGRRKGQE